MGPDFYEALETREIMIIDFVYTHAQSHRIALCTRALYLKIFIPRMNLRVSHFDINERRQLSPGSWAF